MSNAPTPAPSQQTPPASQSDWGAWIVGGVIALAAVLGLCNRDTTSAKPAPTKSAPAPNGFQYRPAGSDPTSPTAVGSNSSRFVASSSSSAAGESGRYFPVAASSPSAASTPGRAGGSSAFPTTPPADTPGTGFGAGSGRYYDPTYRPPVGEHYVSGYYRKDGTYVSGHYQTNRDGSFWNNYSSAGNLNPHTGKVGTKLPPVSRRRR